MLALLAPARISGVYDAITPAAKFGESRARPGGMRPRFLGSERGHRAKH